MTTFAVDIAHEVAGRQRDLVPHADLSPYTGEWVAVRGGEVFAHAPSPDLLRQQNGVTQDDAFLRVTDDASHATGSSEAEAMADIAGQDDLGYASIDYAVGSSDMSQRRPYLVLQVAGPGGTQRLQGLIDTGADATVLPYELASVLGYSADTLESTSVQQLTGSVEAFQSNIPAQAHLPGAPNDAFDLHPVFVPNCRSILWGQGDLAKRFELVFRTSESRLVIGPFAAV